MGRVGSAARHFPQPHNPSRAGGVPGPDYVGQTGRSLRERLGALSRCHSDTMPYRDPHTAAPALWALRHSTGCEFEASAMTTTGDPLLRLGHEALEIGLHRQTHGESPTVQFGRVPVWYRASSPNNARLVAAGNRFRGGPYSPVGTAAPRQQLPAPETARRFDCSRTRTAGPTRVRRRTITTRLPVRTVTRKGIDRARSLHGFESRRLSCRKAATRPLVMVP